MNDITVDSVQVEDTPVKDPNTHFHEWLIENNYQIQVEALTEHNPFLDGKGFVITDRPLLVVTVTRKEDK